MVFLPKRHRLLLSLLAIGTLGLAAYFLPIRKPTPQPVEAPTAQTTPTPTASPSATPPTPKPLSFAEMNALYGPCANLPVLMYHHIQESETAKTNGNGSLTVYPANFEKQLEYLKNKGYQTIEPADLIAFFDSGKSLPKKPVLLTFDDGYADFADLAVPLLSKYGFRATLFVPTGLIENPGYLTWSTIASLPSGVYIGNHTWSHQNMGASRQTDRREISTAQTQLTEHGLNRNKVFAYPYGIISQQAVDFLSDSGFSLAFTTVSGRYQCQKKRLSLPRLRIGNTPSLSLYGL